MNHSGSGKRQAKVLEENYWDCSVCTYRNTAEAFKCLMCDVRKGTSTRKPRINPQLVAQQVSLIIHHNIYITYHNFMEKQIPFFFFNLNTLYLFFFYRAIISILEFNSTAVSVSCPGCAATICTTFETGQEGRERR